jgi:hypothetical protein
MILISQLTSRNKILERLNCQALYACKCMIQSLLISKCSIFGLMWEKMCRGRQLWNKLKLMMKAIRSRTVHMMINLPQFSKRGLKAKWDRCGQDSKGLGTKIKKNTHLSSLWTKKDRCHIKIYLSWIIASVAHVIFRQFSKERQLMN